MCRWTVPGELRVVSKFHGNRPRDDRLTADTSLSKGLDGPKSIGRERRASVHILRRRGPFSTWRGSPESGVGSWVSDTAVA